MSDHQINRIMRVLLFTTLMFLATAGEARQLVLIQGYLGNASSWRDSEITAQLEQNGWQYGGRYYFSSSGVGVTGHGRVPPRSVSPDSNTYFQVSLPTEAPVVRQAYVLNAYLRDLRQRYPDQSLVLAGHSAGGVVARYVMVRNPDLHIQQLITIASPHLGTDIAALGKLAGDSPLALFAPFMGANTLNRSQGLYSDLLPEMPHRFLYWLNRQPHPPADYISIVRDWESPRSGDLIVNQDSQFLENVEALTGRATSYVVKGGHGLNPGDGRLLLDLLSTRAVSPVVPGQRGFGTGAI